MCKTYHYFSLLIYTYARNQFIIRIYECSVSHNSSKIIHLVLEYTTWNHIQCAFLNTDNLTPPCLLSIPNSHTIIPTPTLQGALTPGTLNLIPNGTKLVITSPKPNRPSENEQS